MSGVQVALYKGPTDGLWNSFWHYVTCTFLSIRKMKIVKHSHAELCINGVCYSSSVRDKGVRSKLIDLNSGKWDLKEIQLTEQEVRKSLDRFLVIEGKSYDFLGAIGVVLPLIEDSKSKFFCFEVVAEMLEMPNPSKVTPVELEEFETCR